MTVHTNPGASGPTPPTTPTTPTAWPRIIQGGMGAGVSGWPLARAVSRTGQIGVVSGTALDTILLRRLQDGDPDGDVRRALAAFPWTAAAQAIVAKYFRPEGVRVPGAPRYKVASMLTAALKPEREALEVAANFVEVFLAKEGHAGLVGINYLEKIQLATLPSLYGAMLAGVDVVLMGAGIPAQIPAAIDHFTRHEPASITLDVINKGPDPVELTFDPALHWAAGGLPLAAPLPRPRFFPIVSSATLARALLKKAPGRIDGFVVEAPTAGGHNAPPRGEMTLSVKGEPVYGERDKVDLEQMRSLGIPFWLAGGFASHARLEAAIAEGAQGIQAGTIFAFCQESGLLPELKHQALEKVLASQHHVFTDPMASPTGYPFKVVELPGTLSDKPIYDDRDRVCDLGYLRQSVRQDDGTVIHRCPGEPVSEFVRKGGDATETVGRKCLCNALMANIGMAQDRTGHDQELPLVTAGDDAECIRPLISEASLDYSARDAIGLILGTTVAAP